MSEELMPLLIHLDRCWVAWCSCTFFDSKQILVLS